MGFFALGGLRNLLVVLALEHYSWTTVLFPAAVGVACMLMVALLGLRRTVVDPPVSERRDNDLRQR